MICQSCGMTIGVDCFNPRECMAITQDMAERAEQMQSQESERAHDIQMRDEHIADLRAKLEACEGERGELREALQAIALVAGGAVHPDASHDFHCQVPAEVAVAIGGMRGDLRQAHSLLRRIVEATKGAQLIEPDMRGLIEEARGVVK